jgi:hypothetical protein
MTLDGAGIVLKPVSHGAEGDGTFVRFEFYRRLEERPSVVAVGADVAFFERFGPQHANFISFAPDEPANNSETFRGGSRQSPAMAGRRVQQAVITFDRPRATFSTGYRPRLAQSLAFIGLGVRHIFLGYDHLVFLLALIIVGRRLAHLVKVVTAFSVAHSLTLGLAGLQIVMIPARLVEGTIALTIAYVAFDNFFVSGTAHRPVLTFCFGLVHGFGLAHVLHEMDLPKSEIVSTLLAFNIGVELGQLIILAVLFPVTLWIARQRFGQLVVSATSGVTFLCGVGWFVQRLFDWPLMPI